MNRRDFLRLAGAGLLGFLFPKCGGDEVQIGDLLEKMARKEPLSLIESDTLRVWGNQRQQDAAFVTGMQSGLSNVNADNILPIPAISMSLIYSTVLTEDTATWEMTIPQNFNHLLFIGAGRNDEASDDVRVLGIRFNGDSGASNYIGQYVVGQGSTYAASVFGPGDAIVLGDLPGDSSAAGKAGSFMSLVCHYRSALNKNIICVYTSPRTYEGSLDHKVGVTAGFWLDTDPITSVYLFVGNSQKMMAGSSFSIHGIY